MMMIVIVMTVMSDFRLGRNYSTSVSQSQSQYQQQQHSLPPAYSQQAGYIPNIPNPSLSQGYSMPASQLMNPYSCQQPSPDSQGFANMNLASPQHKQGQLFRVHHTAGSD